MIQLKLTNSIREGKKLIRKEKEITEEILKKTISKMRNKIFN